MIFITTPSREYRRGFRTLIAFFSLIEKCEHFSATKEYVSAISLKHTIYSRNYMPPIFVPSSAKRIATQIVVIAKLNGRKDFILRGSVCDIIHPSK